MSKKKIYWTAGILKTAVLLSAILTFTMLFFLVAYILVKGVPNINLDLFAWKYNSEKVSLMPAQIFLGQLVCQNK